MRVALIAFVLCFQPMIVAAAPALSVPAGGIAIVSPGTAELGGYQITIAPNGDAVAIDLAGRTQRTLPSDLTKALFADAAAAMPLSKLPALCSQPQKMPAPVVVTFNGETSSNVACLTDVKGAALLADVQAVTRVLYVSNLRSRALPPFAAGPNYQPPIAPPAAPPPPPPGGYGGYGHM